MVILFSFAIDKVKGPVIVTLTTEANYNVTFEKIISPASGTRSVTVDGITYDLSESSKPANGIVNPKADFKFTVNMPAGYEIDDVGYTSTPAAAGSTKPKASFSGKDTNLAHFKGLRPLLDEYLHTIPKLPIYDGFMCPLDSIPQFLRPWPILLGFIRNTAVLSLHHIANIDLIDQHGGDCRVLPERTSPPFWLLITQSMQSLILGRVRNPAVVEHPCDSGLAITLRKQRENLAYYSRSFLINDEMSLLCWIFLIPVQSKSANMEPLLAAACQDAANVFRHVLQIPFVDQSVDLSRFFVSLDVGICIIGNADKADTPDGKQAVYILLDQLHLTREPGLGLAQDDIESARLCIIQKALKLRSVAVCTRIVVITIDVINFPILIRCVRQQHSLLISDAIAVVSFVFLVPVLLRESAVYRNFLFHVLSHDWLTNLIVPSTFLSPRRLGGWFSAVRLCKRCLGLFHLVDQFDPDRSHRFGGCRA